MSEGTIFWVAVAAMFVLLFGAPLVLSITWRAFRQGDYVGGLKLSGVIAAWVIICAAWIAVVPEGELRSAQFSGSPAVMHVVAFFANLAAVTAAVMIKRRKK